MPTTGAYEIRLCPKAVEGFVLDERIEDIGLGEWAWIDKSYVFEGKQRLYMICFRCPDCKLLGTLWRETGAGGHHGHDIDSNGNISPSVQCSQGACTFHTQPTRLLGFVEKR